MGTFWTTFIAVVVIYILYYAFTPGGRKSWQEQTKPKKTKEQYRKEWEEQEEFLKEAEKYHELRTTLAQQDIDKLNQTKK